VQKAGRVGGGKVMLIDVTILAGEKPMAAIKNLKIEKLADQLEGWLVQGLVVKLEQAKED
jgi:hypothetical protein